MSNTNPLHAADICNCSPCRASRAARLRRLEEERRRLAQEEQERGLEDLIDWRPRRAQPGSLAAIHRRYGGAS